jgi:hypothetical protein
MVQTHLYRALISCIEIQLVARVYCFNILSVIFPLFVANYLQIIVIITKKIFGLYVRRVNCLMSKWCKSLIVIVCYLLGNTPKCGVGGQWLSL